MPPIIAEDDYRFAYLARRLECGHRPTTIGITYLVTTNGHRQYRPVCMRCTNVPLYNIPHAALTEEEKAAAHPWRSPPPPQQCEHCHVWGEVEIHHWAPSKLFTDSYDWPTSKLCPACHREWHRTISQTAKSA
jgi:hypothetical protein